MIKTIAIGIILLATSSNVLSCDHQKVASDSQDIQTLNSGKRQFKDSVISNCKNVIRPLNPANQPTSSASDLDRYFYLAYNYETEGDFDKAILNYQKAAQLSNCDCDRLHAQAGEKAAREAKKLFKEQGMASKPTQFFWGRLQVLTETLPCVKIE